MSKWDNLCPAPSIGSGTQQSLDTVAITVYLLQIPAHSYFDKEWKGALSKGLGKELRKDYEIGDFIATMPA